MPDKGRGGRKGGPGGGSTYHKPSTGAPVLKTGPSKPLDKRGPKVVANCPTGGCCEPHAVHVPTPAAAWADRLPFANHAAATWSDGARMMQLQL